MYDSSLFSCTLFYTKEIFAYDVTIHIVTSIEYFTENEDYIVDTRIDTIKAGTSHYYLNVTIIGDDKLESNELIRITIHPPVLRHRYQPCSTTHIVILDNDCKFLFHVTCLCCNIYVYICVCVCMYIYIYIYIYIFLSHWSHTSKCFSGVYLTYHMGDI